MSDYLKNDHPDAHIDWPPLATNDRGSAVHEIPAGHVECPKCRGFGGHNLRPNAYPLRPGMEDTPENRHRYVHFRSSCDQCIGWGHVRADDAACIHDWSGGAKTIGRCLTRYTCAKCGKTTDVDSSD